jgi:hypothetical protein
MTPKFRTTIAPVAAVLATAAFATSATARPIDPTVDRPATASHGQDLRMPDTIDAATGRSTSDAPKVTVIKVPQRVSVPEHGVDWADAAIGGGGATALIAISIAGAMTLRRRQTGAHARAVVS